MIKPLNPHYSIENPASVYDEEAMTALQLAARTTAKVNEVVAAQNELQENLPSDIAKEVSVHIEKGEFDRQINEYIGNLESRVDELISRVPEGGTGMDAEVIDIRTDASGMTYANAGSSVRAQVKKAHDTIAQIGDKLGVNVPVYTTCVPGYMDGTGVANGYLTMKAPSADREVTTDYIPLLPGAYFAATVKTDAGTSTGWGRVYVFDANLKPLEAYDLTGTTGNNTITFKDRNKPGAAFVRLSYRTFGNAQVTLEYIKGSDMCREFPHYWDSSDLQLLDVANWCKGYPNGTTGEIVENITDVGFTFTSELIPVTPGMYRLLYDVVNPATRLEDGNSYYAWAAVSMYDQDKTFVERVDYPFTAKNESGKYTLQRDLNVTSGYIRISARSYGNAHLFMGKTKASGGEVVSSGGPTTVKAIAHRGLSEVAPENTMPAYKAAKRAGFHYVECDIQCTSDGEPVLFHDSNLAQKTGGRLSGPVSSYESGVLTSTDVGDWFSPEFAGTTIPTLLEFLDYCRKAGLHPYIEIKTGYPSNHLGTVASYITRSGILEENLTFLGAHLGVMEGYFPKARFGMLSGGDSMAADINTCETKRAAGKDYFIDISITDSVAIEAINSAKRGGSTIPVEAYTLNTKDEILNAPAWLTGFTSNGLHAGKVLAESVE